MSVWLIIHIDRIHILKKDMLYDLYTSVCIFHLNTTTSLYCIHRSKQQMKCDRSLSKKSYVKVSVLDAPDKDTSTNDEIGGLITCWWISTGTHKPLAFHAPPKQNTAKSENRAEASDSKGCLSCCTSFHGRLPVRFSAILICYLFLQTCTPWKQFDRSSWIFCTLPARTNKPWLGRAVK